MKYIFNPYNWSFRFVWSTVRSGQSFKALTKTHLENLEQTWFMKERNMTCKNIFESSNINWHRFNCSDSTDKKNQLYTKGDNSFLYSVFWVCLTFCHLQYQYNNCFCIKLCHVSNWFKLLQILKICQMSLCELVVKWLKYDLGNTTQLIQFIVSKL